MAQFSLISSDSHVTMPDAAWQEYLDPEFRERAPRIEHTDEGDIRVFEGKRTPILTLNNLAGKKPEEFKLNVRKLDEQVRLKVRRDPALHQTQREALAERVADHDHDQDQAQQAQQESPHACLLTVSGPGTRCPGLRPRRFRRPRPASA